jgi:hypothetical protein
MKIVVKVLMSVLIGCLLVVGESSQASAPFSVDAAWAGETAGDQIFLPFIMGENLPDHWLDGLAPGVNWGIAQDYVNDVGITANPYVLDAEDFETGTVTIPTEEDRYLNNTTVVTNPTYTGNYAGQHSWVQDYNGITTRYLISENASSDARPAYFVRMCMNFDSSFHPGESFNPVGVKGFGIYSEPPGGVPNTLPCDGTNWYNVGAQFVGWGPSSKPEANNGFLWVGHLYSYNPYPADATPALGTLANITGYRFSSYASPFKYLKFNEWNCYEVGLYLNTPGIFDGEARFWINGILQSRVTHMRYRDIENLYPTVADLNLYRTTENFPQTMIRWTDNIVIATRYIGPVKLSP